MGPMNFLGSQALHFLAPIVECVFSGNELAQIARLLERRDSLQRLTALIEAKAAASAGARLDDGSAAVSRDIAPMHR